MGDIEYAVKACKKIENILKKKGAKGRGLHQKISSIEHKLADATVKQCRFVATIRNKIVHENSYTHIDDKQAFSQACRDIERSLGENKNSQALVAIFIVIIIFLTVFLLWRTTI